MVSVFQPSLKYHGQNDFSPPLAEIFRYQKALLSVILETHHCPGCPLFIKTVAMSMILF